MTLRPCHLAIFSILVSHPLAAEEATPDQQARFLAGLPVTAPALQALTADESWRRHQREFDAGWSRLDSGQLEKIRQWLPSVLGNDAHARVPLFYMFSGPDFLYANTFFPDASVYVFCGLESVGAIPDVVNLPRGAVGPALGNLRKSLDAIMNFSFFLTKDMKTDLKATQLSGTLPILYVFMARTGNTIQSVEPVGLDKEGNLVAEKDGSPGVKITFSRDDHPPQTLYYFTTDLSNWGVKSKPGFMKFCGQLGDGNSLVKAASYLMHMDEFSSVRDFLLTKTTTLVQDDSGIPFRHFAAEQWDVLFLGRYAGPIKMFEKNYQADLARAFKAGNPPALPFSFGYRWHPNESSLIVATSLRSVPKAVPVPR